MEWSPHRAFPQDLHTLHHSLLLLPLEPRPESKDHPGSLYISHNYHNSPIIMNLTLVPNSNLVGIPVYPIFRQSYDFWTYWFQFGVYPIDKHLCLFLPSEEQNLWILSALQSARASRRLCGEGTPSQGTMKKCKWTSKRLSLSYTLIPSPAWGIILINIKIVYIIRYA